MHYTDPGTIFSLIKHEGYILRLILSVLVSGVLLSSQSRLREAESCYRTALAARPWFTQAHLGLAGNKLFCP